MTATVHTAILWLWGTVALVVLARLLAASLT